MTTEKTACTEDQPITVMVKATETSFNLTEAIRLRNELTRQIQRQQATQFPLTFSGESHPTKPAKPGVFNFDSQNQRNNPGNDWPLAAAKLRKALGADVDLNEHTPEQLQGRAGRNFKDVTLPNFKEILATLQAYESLQSLRCPTTAAN